MKLAVEYDIEGNITIGSQYGIEAGGLEYIFVPDDMGHLQSIRIIAPIANPQQVTSTIDPGNSRVHAAVLNFNVPGDVIRSLNQEFQELESSLAFESFGALRRVNWQNPRHELMAETEEEAQQIAVTNFQIQRRFPNPEVQINSRHMAKVIQGKRRYADLTVLKSFWREGMNDYNEFKFINAFNNFYLVIEGLYGAGKTQNRAILRQYLEVDPISWTE